MILHYIVLIIKPLALSHEGEQPLTPIYIHNIKFKSACLIKLYNIKKAYSSSSPSTH